MLACCECVIVNMANDLFMLRNNGRNVIKEVQVTNLIADEYNDEPLKNKQVVHCEH